MKSGDIVYLPVEFLEEDEDTTCVKLKYVDDESNTHIFWVDKDVLSEFSADDFLFSALKKFKELSFDERYQLFNKKCGLCLIL